MPIAAATTLPPAEPVVVPAAAPVPAVAGPVAAPVPSVAVMPAIAEPSPEIVQPPAPPRGEDSILAKIIANIDVPGAELDVEPVRPSPEPEPAPVAAQPEPAVAVPLEADRAASEAKALAEQKAADRLANEQKVADKKASDKKIADKKLADKKLAEAKKAEDLKKKNDPKLLEPSRIWVQVAGGANEASLPKEWAKVRDKAPAAFKGKSGWTTPLRLTNRVLAGPFKTDGEARAFVNTLAKSDVSAFTFTSDAGQKIAKLAVK